MPLEAVVSLLQCPRCGGDLTSAEDSVQCVRCHAVYGVADGVPLLAPTSGVRGDRFPLVYDLAQIVFGGRKSRSRVASLLTSLAPSSVLDVGGGTGFYAPAVPTRAHYVAVDTDAAKIRRLRAQQPRADAVVADAAALPIRDDAVDVALLIAVAHHLPDDVLNRALSELARVTRQRVLFIDPVASNRLTARALWRLDRGSYRRSPEELTDQAEPWFELEHVQVYSIRHDYLLWVGAPRTSDIP